MPLRFSGPLLDHAFFLSRRFSSKTWAGASLRSPISRSRSLTSPDVTCAQCRRTAASCRPPETLSTTCNKGFARCPRAGTVPPSQSMARATTWTRAWLSTTCSMRYKIAAARIGSRPPFSDINPTISSIPCPCFNDVNANGRSPRWTVASRRITSRLAPT